MLLLNSSSDFLLSDISLFEGHASGQREDRKSTFVSVEGAAGC